MGPLHRDSLEFTILALLDRRPDHGYRLMLRVRDVTGQDLSDGTLYPTLARLEASGKIEGTWSLDGGRKRKTWALTDKGRKHLGRARSAWPQFRSSMEALLGGQA